MKEFIFLIMAACGAVMLQAAVLPAYIPPVLRPDACLLIGIAILAFAPRELGLISVFCMGLIADLFSSGRFGLLTLCYLLSTGVILWAAWRELTRGDVLAGWIGGLAATLLAHVLYVVIARRAGFDLPWSQSLVTITGLLVGALVWGLPIAWICGKMMYRMGIASPQVREKWAAAARLSAARRGKSSRA